MSANKTLRIILALSLAVLLPSGDAFAGRGGGGGGGRAGGGGGGGGAHFGGGGGGGGVHYGGGGGMARPSFSPAPTFSTPHPSFPAGGGFNRPTQSFHPSAPITPRVQNFNQGAVNNLNRTNVNNFNRTNVNNFNRTNVNNFNRTEVNTINRTNVGVNNFSNNVVNRPVNVTNNYTRVNSISGGGYGGAGYGGYGNRWAGRTPYWGYHQNWVNGAWNSNYYPSYGGYGGYGGGYGNNLGYFGLGLAAGGLAGFGLGSSLSNWGYSGYSNPYYYSSPSTVIVQQPLIAQQPPTVVYDYSQPIDTLSAPPQASAAEPALATFDTARQAFAAGDYATALARTDAALVSLPNDPTLHEFRGLVFFALGQYDAAAATLYPVLSAGPGWDWTTLVGLYPSVDVYTAQLRALEDDSRANPGKASDHFVLAYQYLTEGFPENAANELRAVAQIQPKDTLSARLLTQISRPATVVPGPGDNPPVPPVAANVPRGSLLGTWTARPTPDNTITLTVTPDGNFTWTIADKTGPRNLTGGSTYGNDVLTLAPATGDPLVGRVAWTDASHFNFQAVGGGAGDPGLAFQKTGG